MTKRDPEPHLPLTPAMFHVLVALSDGDKHGYAILMDVKRRTEAKVKLGAGALYAVIKRLLDDDMIVESDARPDAALDDERGHYYRLTPFGRQVAIAEAERMEQAVSRARAKRLIGKPRLA